jgi:hypothetical protein
MNMLLAIRIVPLLCLTLASGCASLSITARHTPLYRAEAHTSTISATASSDAGIQSISVQVLTGELVACKSNYLSSIFPCRQNGWWVTYVCRFGFSGRPLTKFPKIATCNIPKGISNWSLITYQAQAVSGSGAAASTNYITYAGGPAPPGTRPVLSLARAPAPAPPSFDPLDPPDPPPPPPVPQPSAGDILRPAWLETDVPPRPFQTPQPTYFDGARRIDVMFLPDADWDTHAAFAEATNNIMERTFFNPPLYPSRYAEDYTFWRKLFSLWIGPPGAETPTPGQCGHTFSDWAAIARSMTDGKAIVHKEYFRDCAWLGRSESGTVFAEPNAAFTFTHESGHFLFCLADEYTETGYTERYSCSDPPNTFKTLEACKQTAAALGFAESACVLIPQATWWHVDFGPSHPEIMGDWAFPVGFVSTDWQDTNHHAFQKRMAKCLAGTC